jgi:hypothetical protein
VRPRAVRAFRNLRQRGLLAMALALLATLTFPTMGAAETTNTALALWRASDFDAWTIDRLRRTDTGAYESAGGPGETGTATSPPIRSDFAITAVVPSWNVHGGDDARSIVRVRVDRGDGWSDWLDVADWRADSGRRSTPRRAVGDASIDVDTVRIRGGARSVQLQIALVTGTGGPSRLDLAGLALSGWVGDERSEISAPRQQGVTREIEIQGCSQMVYPDGGRVWCSPTSTAMILGRWIGLPGCAEAVRAAVRGVFDPVYRGHGNWSFNTAYAGTVGLDAYVARLPSLAAAEEWIEAGVPLAFSFAFGPGELPGAPIASTNGHLAVLAGFDANGDPIVHDPAAPSDGTTRRVYDRARLERLWQEHSGGTVYVIHPTGWPAPTGALTSAVKAS